MVDLNNLRMQSEIINKYINKVKHSCMKEAKGQLKYKFLDPGAGYHDVLWDWDSYFCAISLAKDGAVTGDYLKGCIENFLDHINSDGSIPFNIRAQGNKENEGSGKIRTNESVFNSIKPLLSQMSLFAGKLLKDYTWIKPHYSNLKYYIKHWEDTQLTCWGLFVWRSHRGNGTDNHPALYGRPLNSTSGVDLNSFMYREYVALSKVAELCGELDEAKDFRKKAEALKDNINKYMWDPIDKMYYNLDLSSRQPERTNQPITWVIPMKIKAWIGFMPLWAEIAPEGYAKELVEIHLTSTKEFWSDNGICSLAMNEPAFNLFKGKNPSDWQGPIWVVANYITFRGLIQYGYKEEAGQLLEKILNLLAADIVKNGAMCEYYDPRTGEGLMNPGFLNWNMLAGIMLQEYEENVNFSSYL